ncbi:hypothetical protein ACFLUF_01985 [Chloroflexota bacterium]
MTSQDYGPADTGSANPLQAGDILYPMRVSLFIALLLMGYVLSRPQTTNIKEEDIPTPGATREWESLPPWQRKASDRAIERYTRSQGKKWRRWNEAMFERSG